MRKAPMDAGAAPAPPSCGVKNRDATLEKTKSAEKPWKFGTLTRPATPGILELFHSIGNVRGVAPKTPKSYAYAWTSQQTSRKTLSKDLIPAAGQRGIWCARPGLKELPQLIRRLRAG